MTLQDIADAILGQSGALFLVLVILWAGWKGYWVFGRYYDKALSDNEKLERRLDRAVGIAERGTGLANRAVERSEARGGQTEVSGE